MSQQRSSLVCRCRELRTGRVIFGQRNVPLAENGQLRPRPCLPGARRSRRAERTSPSNPLASSLHPLAPSRRSVERGNGASAGRYAPRPALRRRSGVRSGTRATAPRAIAMRHSYRAPSQASGLGAPLPVRVSGPPLTAVSPRPVGVAGSDRPSPPPRAAMPLSRRSGQACAPGHNGAAASRASSLAPGRCILPRPGSPTRRVGIGWPGRLVS